VSVGCHTLGNTAHSSCCCWCCWCWCWCWCWWQSVPWLLPPPLCSHKSPHALSRPCTPSSTPLVISQTCHITNPIHTGLQEASAAVACHPDPLPHHHPLPPIHLSTNIPLILLCLLATHLLTLNTGLQEASAAAACHSPCTNTVP
jgi:hypothetical protein